MKSYEYGFTLKRSQELTRHKIFSIAELRDCFFKMTPQEQKIINTNVKNEIKETEHSIANLLSIRKKTFVPNKPIYTQKIKESKKLLKGQKQRLLKCLLKRGE